ncbi:hypothetical protein [Parasporobacterium paucivorans]|uniref:Uncharacterized protein n=1 Tax=Parasporobacterium paucivorans DSM 15970 TaxID=1122934 RepID=A0A1M6A1W2_9FIRM|nr:hypothetical protein [Parasporobacterium paucivorans]SHI30418.1 hypothetical protein SAMN02745691_00031 [Parasporobacterium paucivorans DSM 15970]
MNIRILKNVQDFESVTLQKDMVVEKKFPSVKFSSIKSVKYFIYDTKKRYRKEEILPKIKKIDFIDCIDAVWDSGCVYFTACSSAGYQHKTFVEVYRYNILDRSYDIIYSFVDSLSEFDHNKKMKIFILNSSHMIIQTAYPVQTESRSEDYLKFDLTLFGIKDKTSMRIVDENLVHNGIDDIIPISASRSAMKTGFSLLESNRHTLLTKEEASVEGISIINIQQLISDLLLRTTNVAFDPIGQAYFSKTFAYMDVQGNFLIYSAINFDEQNEEIFFYNFASKEMKTCINNNILEYGDIARPCVMDDTPLLWVKNQKGTELVNLNKEKVHFSFSNEIVVEDIINNFVITSGMAKRKFFRSYSPYFTVYKYPQMNLLLQENAFYLGCVSPDGESLDIFVK